MKKRYCKNKETNVVFPYETALMDQPHFAECDEDGVEIGRANIGVINIETENAALKAENAKLKADIEFLEEKVKVLTAEIDLKKSSDPQYIRANELSGMDRANLVEIAEKCGIAVGKKSKEQLAKEIISAEFNQE